MGVSVQTSRCASKGLDPGMSSLERPKLRPVNSRRVEHQGQSFVMLQDVTGAISQPVLIPIDGFNHIVRHFNGQSTLIEIQGHVLRSTGLFLALNELEGLVNRLDAAMLIEGPTFEAFHQVLSRIGKAAGRAGRTVLCRHRAGAARPARAVFRRWRRCGHSRRQGGRSTEPSFVAF